MVGEDNEWTLGWHQAPRRGKRKGFRTDCAWFIYVVAGNERSSLVAVDLVVGLNFSVHSSTAGLVALRL